MTNCQLRYPGHTDRTTALSMPPFSSHRPQFSHFRRSHSPSPTPSPAGGDSSTSYSPSLNFGSYNTAAPYLCPPNFTHSTQSQQALVPQHSQYPPATSSQQSLSPHHLTQSSSQYSPQSPNQNQGLLAHAHDFTITGSTFIDGDITYINTPLNKFMEKLLEKTIPGAASDSSARYPPPRCHPGTRLAILDRCISFITTCDGEKKMLWVVGAAGVGKSAIMQNVAESPNLPVTSNASVFFSINGRSDGTKAVTTLSYQLAAKSELYRRVIEDEITRDPSLLQASMPVQFKKLIVEPFIHTPHLNSAGRVLIIIDGLDECKNPRTQQELLRLICDLCTTYPSSPLVWFIASRPETHITSFFSRAEAMPAYEKEEIAVDSDEARADVERFLRDELTEIQKASDSLDPQWPGERVLWKLASASGGLFAYAHTATRYIGDSNIGDPASQLFDVLNVIDRHPMTDVPREEHPLALLDALYTRILSNVPLKVMKNTRKILLALASNWDSVLFGDEQGFIVLCNWLGMTRDVAYAVISHLHSLLRVPRRNKAHEQKLEPFHKSFIDFISDYNRSGFSPDIKLEAQQLRTQCAFKILEKAPDGIDFSGADYRMYGCGTLARGPGTGDNILLTWLADEDVDWNDNKTRSSMYKLAIGEIIRGIERHDPTFESPFCVRLLTTRFVSYFSYLLDGLCELVFHDSRRHEFIMHGILKPTPLKTIDVSTIFTYWKVGLQFRRPATTVPNLSDPWNSSCRHERVRKSRKGQDVDWMTKFRGNDCASCLQQLGHHLENWTAKRPDHTVLILFTSDEYFCVEFRFVDPEDGISEWTYWFWCRVPLEQRRKYESTV